MPIIFKSKATGDLLMLTAHAGALLGRLGKSTAGPGILSVSEMAEALKVLKQLDDHVGSQDPAGDEGPDTPPLLDEPVSLRKRAVPLVRMIEEALQASEPIVWGV